MWVIIEDDLVHIYQSRTSERILQTIHLDKVNAVFETYNFGPNVISFQIRYDLLISIHYFSCSTAIKVFHFMTKHVEERERWITKLEELRKKVSSGAVEAEDQVTFDPII